MDKKKLLIVEDEESIAIAERMILKDQFDVVIAKDGAEGLEKAKELRPDVIVLDVMMPKMSGFEVLKAIRDDNTLTNTKVVMVTAKDQDSDEKTGMETGADDYIMKPFEDIELMHVVNQVLKY